MRIPLLLLSLLLLPLTACVQPDAETTETERLAGLLAQRLEIAEEVAWSKKHTGAPVLDPEREALLMLSMIQQGKEVGLSVDQVRSFFLAQMAASRQLQAEKLEGWAQGALLPQTAPLDLREDIRPRMETLSNGLIFFLASVSPKKLDPDAVSQDLKNRGFSEEVVELAASGVSDFKKASGK